MLNIKTILSLKLGRVLFATINGVSKSLSQTQNSVEEYIWEKGGHPQNLRSIATKQRCKALLTHWPTSVPLVPLIQPNQKPRRNIYAITKRISLHNEGEKIKLNELIIISTMFV